MTPIRVRGKRYATKDEKWHSGKQRNASRHQKSSQRSSSMISDASSSRRKRKRREPELSRLEELPTEVLHAIFEFSANPNLPIASPRLASQLASRHLYHELTSEILRTVLRGQRSSTEQLRDASRLMNSKFFTWQFFKGWLHTELDGLDLSQERQVADGEESTTSVREEQHEQRLWHSLRPNSHILPPKKLLCSPFTQDKMRFLRLIKSSFRDDPDRIHPASREMIRQGLAQAIAEGAGDILPCFWTFGMQVDTELLRSAVIDSGCKKEIVSQLVTQSTRSTSESSQVDFLDPALWSWADKARAKSDEKGPWLMEMLRAAARDSGRRDEGKDHPY